MLVYVGGLVKLNVGTQYEREAFKIFAAYQAKLVHNRGRKNEDDLGELSMKGKM